MDYFYEHESELFTFYRVPKVLFTEEQFKNISCEAKLLYGLLLDKMGLSRKSGWFDKQGRAFVYYGISRSPQEPQYFLQRTRRKPHYGGLGLRPQQGGEAAIRTGASWPAAPETAGVGEAVCTVPPEIRKPNFLTFDFRISRTLKISAPER